MNTKAIFLDIDGVLNCYGVANKNNCSKSRCGSYIGIDKDKTKRLAKIVQSTKAILILSSSWKIGWEPKGRYKIDGYDIHATPYNYHAKYLDNHLKKKGKLILHDKTREENLLHRGEGIKNYLTRHPEITNWIVLDDEIFSDFYEYDIMPHLLKTNPNWGLTDNDAEVAIKMLNGQVKGPYKGGPLLNLNDPFDYNIITQKKTKGPEIIRKE